MSARTWLLMLALFFAAGGCCKITVADDPDELEDPLAGASSNRQRNLWRYRYKRGLLPNPDQLPPLEEKVQRRSRQPVAAPHGPDPAPFFDPNPPGKYPYVYVDADSRVTRYEGSFEIVGIGPRRVVGKLANSNTQVTLHYRTPGSIDYSSFDLPDRNWFLEMELVWAFGSMHERVMLSYADPGGAEQLLFAYYSWGALTELLRDDWRTRVGMINVRQDLVRRDGIARVNVGLNNPDDAGLIPLLPGMDVVYSAPIQVYCMNSAVMPVAGRGIGGGDLCHVDLFFYRR